MWVTVKKFLGFFFIYNKIFHHRYKIIINIITIERCYPFVLYPCTKRVQSTIGERLKQSFSVKSHNTDLVRVQYSRVFNHTAPPSPPGKVLIKSKTIDLVGNK